MKQIFSCLLTCFVLLYVCSCEKEIDINNPDAPSGSSADNSLKISLDKEELTIEVGKTAELVASFVPENAENKAHEWSSSDSKIATVDTKGLVKAISVGTADITAKSLATGATASCKVTVVEKSKPTIDFKVKEIQYGSITCSTSLIPGIDLKVCYGKSPHPTVTDHTAKITIKNNEYSITMDGLARCQYYFRAFSIENNEVTYYDNEESEFTLQSDKCPSINTHDKETELSPPYGYVRHNVDYQLPEGTYEVTSFSYGSAIGRMSKDWIYFASNNLQFNENTFNDCLDTIYVSGGTGSFYIVNKRTAYISGNDDDYIIYVKFRSLETDISYVTIVS